MTSKHLAIVAGDGHVGQPYERYRSYIDPDYRDRLDELAETQAFYRQWAHVDMLRVPEDLADVVDPERTRARPDVSELYWDVKKRVAELDAEGIALELVFCADDMAPFFGAMNAVFPPDARAAGIRAFNRFAADVISESNGRIRVNGETSPDIEEAVAQLPWLAEHGFKSVTPPGYEPDVPSIDSREYDRFWAACQELGLVLNMHVGWGGPQGVLLDLIHKVRERTIESIQGTNAMETVEAAFLSAMAEEADAKNPNSPFHHTIRPQQAMWRLMLGGVFDRYPDLTLVFTELRADWVPTTLDYLERKFAESTPTCELTPREYYARNVAVTPSSPHRAELELRHEIGVSQFMFGTDLPHPESTWPNTRQWIRDAFQGVPEDEARMILGENAIRIFNLDASAIDEDAARIGITFDDVMSDPELDDRLLDHFHSRAGYLRPAQGFASDHMDQLLEPDLVRLGA